MRFAVAVCILAVVASAAGAAEIITIAVMPFANITKDAQIDWLGAGFAETIATKLCMVSGIQYVERSQLAQALKELKLQDTAVVDPKTAGKLGKVIGARQIVLGSYQKLGDKLKVDARVVDVETSVATRSADDTGTMDGVFDLQADLARKLIEALGKTATEAESKAVAVAPTRSLSAFEWFSKGYTLYQQGKLADAIQAYTSAIELDPRYVDAYNNRGVVYKYASEYERAIADYTKAIALKPDYADAYFNRGVAYRHTGEPDKAIADLDKALALKPDSPDVYNNLGNAWGEKGDLDKAIVYLNKAITIKPDYPYPYFGKGHALELQGKREEALAAFQQFIKLAAPGDAEWIEKAKQHIEGLEKQ
jgi:tetratricopeptide (TPR) repeat protein